MENKNEVIENVQEDVTEIMLDEVNSNGFIDSETVDKGLKMVGVATLAYLGGKLIVKGYVKFVKPAVDNLVAKAKEKKAEKEEPVDSDVIDAQVVEAEA